MKHRSFLAQFVLLGLLVAGMLSTLPLYAQTYDEALYNMLEYRLVGPFRGGRSTAV